jgi:hypothetical protein
MTARLIAKGTPSCRPVRSASQPSNGAAYAALSAEHQAVVDQALKQIFG